MSRNRPSSAAHLVGLPTKMVTGAHVDPNPEHREAADAFLRGAPVQERLIPMLERVVDSFGWAEHGYIEEARRSGEQARIWNTAHWIIANALAREAHAQARS